MITIDIVGGGARTAARVRARAAFGARAPVGIAAWLGVVSLLLAVQVGLGATASERLGNLPGGAALDYAHRANQIVEPLSDEFLAQALGLPLPVTPGPTAIPAGPDHGTGGPLRVGEDPRPPVAAIDHAPTNDDREAAYSIAQVPFTARTDASRATREPGEPSSCTTADRTVWYRYVADREVRLGAQVVGGGPTLAVFEGDALRPVGCDSAFVNPAARVTFLPRIGATYWFQVATTASTPVTFSLDTQGTTERVTLAADGGDPDSVSIGTELSADGRYVVFESWASNLVPGDTNESVDVFVYDRKLGITERVSVNSDGEQGNGNSGDFGTNISADGRYVAFHSFATNLVPGDTNGWTDVFVRDRLTGTTERVSVDSDGRQGAAPLSPNGDQIRELLCREVADREPTNQLEDPFLRGAHMLAIGAGVQCTMGRDAAISADGRFVAFATTLTGLDERPASVTDDVYRNVYVHDRATGVTVLASIGPDGRPWTGGEPALSADGRIVAMTLQQPTALSPLYGEPPGHPPPQVYVRNLATGHTELVSMSTSGAPAENGAWTADLSADGRYVSFDSTSGNLADGDGNQRYDVFVRDRLTGTTLRASVSSNGDPGELDSAWASISADGRYVAYVSQANLANGPVGAFDIFVHDLDTRTTTLVSVNSSGEPANDSSGYPKISADGRHIAFGSWASNLDEGDHNGEIAATYEPDHEIYQFTGRDIFVHSLGAGP